MPSKQRERERRAAPTGQHISGSRCEGLTLPGPRAPAPSGHIHTAAVHKGTHSSKKHGIISRGKRSMRIPARQYA